MPQLSRRRLLKASSGISAGVLTGCVSANGRSTTESPESPGKTTEDANSITDWKRSTNCDSMHDSVIRVERVATSLGDEYAPIHFANLSPEEKRILRSVTEEGGYGTCDSSDAFQQFIGRVSDYRTRQDGDDMRIYLERESTYYGLYVEDLDQVYAY